MADGIVGRQVRTGFSTGIAGEAFAVNAAVYGPADADFSALISFVAVGTGGDYRLVFTPVVADPNYYARWTGTVSGAEFTETWRILTAAQADPLAALLSGTVVLQSPVLADGYADLIAGDDYLSAIGRALTWTLPDQAIPGGATLAFVLYKPDDTVALTTPMTVVQVGPPAIVAAELTRAETAVLPAGTLRDAIVMTRAGGEVVTLLRSELTVGTVPP